MDSTEGSNRSFFKHVFNFDDDSKAEVFNVVQYALLAIVPVVLLNKLIARYLPEADNKKGTVEISAEVIMQVIVTLLGLLLIHRIITFVPNFSGVKYPEFHLIYVILAMLQITMSLQTKLGEKVSILSERVMELWTGKPAGGQKGANGKVKVSQPLSGQAASQLALGGQPSGTDISALPMQDNSQANLAVQQLPNYNNMYRQDMNPLVGAAQPSMEGMAMYNEPMAANAVLGGSSFGTW